MSATLSTLSSVHQTQVDLGGLMTVLGQHLYSTPIVAVRELVQNAHDSLVRRRMEDLAWQGEGKILVEGDLAAGVLRISDCGAGLTADEIHSFLATVGVGYTRKLRESSDSENLIGLFGLGFLSAFVLAEEVIVRTTSYQEPTRGWCYKSSNGEQYSLSEIAPRAEVGTEVELRLRDTYRQLAGQTMLTRVLGRYCALLSEPLYIGALSTPLNEQCPPWRRVAGDPLPHPALYRRQCLSFATRFEDRFEPICTLPVTPLGASDAQGLLWVQDGASYASSDNRNLSVFVRGMLLDDDARDLLPPWAGFIGGVIESSHLTPTASREDLQKDDVYHAVQEALTESLIAGLADIAKSDSAAWRRVLLRHNEALLGAALCDPRLFALLANDLRLPSSQGDLSAQALRVSGNVHVALGSGGGFEEMLFRALKVPVARGDRYAVVPFLREWVKQRGGKLIEVGTEQGNRALITPGEISDEERDWLSAALCDGEQLTPAHFAPHDLPLVVVRDRDAELKQRLEKDEADARISVAALRLARAFTAQIDGSALSRLYLNLDCPAVQSLLAAHRQGAPHADEAIRVLWAMKVMLSSGDEESSLDLSRALGELGAVVQKLLAT